MTDQSSTPTPAPAPAGFEHGFATVDGLRLHYVTGGRADGEVLVLLAGFPQSWYAWRKVMPLLAPTYRIIVPDLPGHGDSDRPAEGYDTRSLAEAIHGLLQHLGVTRYVLAGHDIGAWVAYPYAALFGDEVRRVVFLDAGIPGVTLPDALPTTPERVWWSWHFMFHTVPDLPEMLISGRERDYLEFFLRRRAAHPEVFTDDVVAEYLRVFTRDDGLRAGLAYYRAAATSAAQNRALGAAGRLRMPVLAISAERGAIPDMAGPLRAVADTVEDVRIASCGHFIPEEQPDAVAAAFEAFFR